MRRLGKVLLGVVFAFAAANATIIPSLVSVTGDIATPGDFDFNYQAVLSGDEQLNTGAIGADTTACTGGTNCLPFFTIYDFPTGSFFNVPSPPTDWGVEFQLTGITPTTINGSFDDGGLLNVTFYYTGATILGPETFAGFIVVTNSGWGGTDPNGKFSSQATENNSGLTTDQTSGSIAVPAATSGPTGGVPEPASTLLVGGGLLALGLFGRRMKRRS
jgi:hypothetical protein